MGIAILPSQESKYQLVFIYHCRRHNGKGNVWWLVIVLRRRLKHSLKLHLLGCRNRRMSKTFDSEPFRHSIAFWDVYNAPLQKYQGLLINTYQRMELNLFVKDLLILQVNFIQICISKYVYFKSAGKKESV